MTRTSIRESLAAQRARYRLASRSERSRLLDEVVAVTRYHRKAAIRLLRETPRPRTSRAPVGRPRRYRCRACGPLAARCAGAGTAPPDRAAPRSW